MNRTLRLGTAKIDITPRKPVPLAGFADRTGVFDGVAKPLYAKVWFFEQTDEAGMKRSALLVQADLIWWGSDRMAAIRHALSTRCGLAETSVILHATHTHSGPQTSSRFTPSIGKPDLEYLQWLEESLISSVIEAQSCTEPVCIEKASGVCRIGVHRRKMTDNGIVMAPNPDGPLDPEAAVIRFRTDAGATKGVLVHYACHPTTTADNDVSSEYCGAAMEELEQALDDGAIVSFLQGCSGDIRPALIKDGAFYRGDRSDVDRLGQTLAEEVMRILSRPMTQVAPSELFGAQATVQLPVRRLPDRAELLSREREQGALGEWSRLLLNDPDRVAAEIPLELTYLQVAEGVSFLAMNGEVVVEYGFFIKQHSAGQVLPLPYSNGMIGYVPTAVQVAEGGYEAEQSFSYFGLPSPFDASLEKRICEGIQLILGRRN